MSRHILAPKGRSTGYVVVGFDRPLGVFFLQDFDDEDLVDEIDCLEDLDDINDFVAEFPDNLRQLLIVEAAGDVETNIIIDWRENDADED